MASLTTIHMMLERGAPDVTIQVRAHPTLRDCWFLMVRDVNTDFTISGTRAQLEELGRKLHLEVDRVGRMPGPAHLDPDLTEVDK